MPKSWTGKPYEVRKFTVSKLSLVDVAFSLLQTILFGLLLSATTSYKQDQKKNYDGWINPELK
jgi:hypothetical protein